MYVLRAIGLPELPAKLPRCLLRAHRPYSEMLVLCPHLHVCFDCRLCCFGTAVMTATHRPSFYLANVFAPASPGSLAFSILHCRRAQHFRRRDAVPGAPPLPLPRLQQRRGWAAAAAAPSSPGSAVANGQQGAWEKPLTDLLSAEGGWDPDSPHLQACVRRGSALVSWLAGREGVGLPLAMQLAMVQCRLEAADASADGSIEGSSGSSSSSGGSGASTSSSAAGAGGGASSGGPISAKFELFRRLTSAEPGWAAALARALADWPDAAALPLHDTQAALRFAAVQVGAWGILRR